VDLQEGALMPDWMTHLLIAYVIASWLRIKEKPVLLGALLPDIFKIFIPVMLLLDMESLAMMNLFASYHTIVGVLLSGLLVASFFEDLRKAYLPILTGAFSHLFADIFLYPWGTKIWTLWPFWTGQLNIGILWPDSFIPLGIALSLFVVAYYRAGSSC
jgi:hypothetical protein